MRNWATNPVKYESVIVAEALFLTIVIHLGLLFLFGYARPTPKQETNDNGYASMLNVESLSESERQRVVMFLDYNDPSVISRPRVDLTQPGARRVPDQPRQDRVVSVGDELVVEDPSLIDEGSVGGMPIVRQRATPRSIPASSRVFPVAISTAGTELNLVLTDGEKALLSDMELKPTILMLHAPGENELIGRFTILSSSGRNALDLTAIRQLQENRLKLLNGEPSVRVAVWWQEKKQ